MNKSISKPKAALAGVFAALAAAVASPASAQQVTLRVHHFLPATASAHVKLIQPWCDKIAKESADRLKCQIFPSMQLGGAPGQLYDQVKDGVVDVVWTVPTYAAGRFTKSEVFAIKDGKETLCALMQQTIMVMHGKAEK